MISAPLRTYLFSVHVLRILWQNKNIKQLIVPFCPCLLFSLVVCSLRSFIFGGLSAISIVFDFLGLPGLVPLPRSPPVSASRENLEHCSKNHTAKFVSMGQMPYDTFNNYPVPASSLHISPSASLHAPPSLADDCDSVLDENILDSCRNSTMSPTEHGQRRQSFPNSVAFSPNHSTWSEYPIHSEPSSASHQQYFFEQHNHAFPRHAPSHPPFHPGLHWQPQNGMDVCAPPAFLETMNPDYDVKDSSIVKREAIGPQVPEVDGYGGSIMDASLPYHAKQAPSTSPQSEHSWESHDQVDLRSLPKDQLAGVLNSNPPLLRRDGIRKKNARFEIPAERTLRTIDQLIAQTHDETQIKELKQQKRLLRNRQAALDSRQRKKQHTERLEEEKKQTSSIMTELEEAVSTLRIQQVEWNRQRDAWMAEKEHYTRFIEDMHLEKEEMVRRHTIETTDLRRKNAILMEQSQKMESIAMSAVPSSTGYSTDFSDFGNLTMESSPWDHYSYDFNPLDQQPEQKQETALVMLPKKDTTPQPPNHHNAGNVRPTADGATSGLLLMLLLCGAWVASQSDSSLSTTTTSSTSTSLIPKLPEHVRVASSAVLESIYHDAGIQPSPQQPHGTSSTQTSFDVKTSPTLNHANPSAFPHHMSSSLQALHHRLITPSAEQQRLQAFGLTPEQYNALNEDADGEPDDEIPTFGASTHSNNNNDQHHQQQSASTPTPQMGHHRRNLREVLAAFQQSRAGVTDAAGAGASSSSSSSGHGEPASEIYTRSLLWNEVQPEVVRDFARMVREMQGERGGGEPMA